MVLIWYFNLLLHYCVNGKGKYETCTEKRSWTSGILKAQV